jgi:hypothetical protein
MNELKQKLEKLQEDAVDVPSKEIELGEGSLIEQVLYFKNQYESS